MSHHITTPVLACFYAGGHLYALALALADACPDASGRGSRKSVARLAHESRSSERTTQSALRRLQADGWLHKEGAGAGGRGHTTCYRIDAAWLDAARQEIADASIEKRSPRLVPPPNQPAGQKGAELAPFADPETGGERVQFGPVKGAKKRLKGAAHGLHPNREQKTEHKPPYPPPAAPAVGVCAKTTNPEARTTSQPTTPLPAPPTGQRPGHDTAARPAEQGGALPEDLGTSAGGRGGVAGVGRAGGGHIAPGDGPGFAEFERLYPRVDAADRRPARRVWANLGEGAGQGPGAAKLARMHATLALDRARPQWCEQQGRFVPKLSRWLRGWLGDGPPDPLAQQAAEERQAKARRQAVAEAEAQRMAASVRAATVSATSPAVRAMRAAVRVGGEVSPTSAQRLMVPEVARGVAC